MPNLSDFYTDFSRIDLDTRGGYARVAQVKTCRQNGLPEFCAFKLMRHEIDRQKGLERFEDELKLLARITKAKNAPSAITRIYDSGFVREDLSPCLHERGTPVDTLQVHSAGIEAEKFIKLKSKLLASDSIRWLPYLTVELAPYDNSLLRLVHHQPKDDLPGFYRLPTGEVIALVVQLLTVMDYLHKEHGRAYMDWKPEHLFWDGLGKQAKLIDWNVTVPLEDGPGEKQNILDDIRLLCGATLYIGLTLIDPDDPIKPIGPRPTEELQNPVSEIRRRYWTDNPNFYEHSSKLDEKIKKIIQKGLNPKQGFESPTELKEALLSYLKQELGATEDELMPGSPPASQYFQAIAKVRMARHQFLEAQQDLIRAVGAKGANPEFTWLFETINRALIIFPGS